MSRKYTITFSEQDIDNAIIILEVIENVTGKENKTFGDMAIDETLKEIIQKLKQAKQKPYTNFDKIKDEMTIEDAVISLQDEITDKYCVVKEFKECEDRIDCEECIKKWLESEVKENE